MARTGIRGKRARTAAGPLVRSVFQICDNGGMIESREGLLARVRQLGLAGASPIDLLAIGMARTAPDVELCETQARKVLQQYGSVRAVVELGAESLQREFGVEEFESLRAMALLELGRRIAKSNKPTPGQIDSPEDAYAELDDLRLEKKEHFVALFLNAKNGLIRRATIHVGTLTMSLVGIREVFREAIREGASQIIVAHNHPSGDPTPSPEDLEITAKLSEAGQLLDIPVVDHIIVGEGSWTSFREKGLMRGI